MVSQRVCVTGFGLVSPAGSEATEVWEKLQSERPWTTTIDASRFAPFLYHREAAFDASTQIKTRTHIRSMGRAQLNGTHAAGLALQSAGIKDDAELLARTELLVACSAGDNDVEIDTSILAGAANHVDEKRERLDIFLNARLMGMRPSLYLNQLPNLFAANISICYGVIGSSLTFIGDEVAGMNAVNTGYQRIKAGQSDIVLVGGVSEGARLHYLESFAAKEELLEGDFVEIWERQNDRTCFGNGAGFLVLESEAHARRRGADIKCFLSGLELSHAPRSKASAPHQTRRLVERMPLSGSALAQVITCSNVSRATLAEEESFWVERTPNYQNICNVVGGMLEAALPMSLALGALSLQRKATLPPVSTRHERAKRRENPGQLVIACWGRSRGESVALLEA